MYYTILNKGFRESEIGTYVDLLLCEPHMLFNADVISNRSGLISKSCRHTSHVDKNVNCIIGSY